MNLDNLNALRDDLDAKAKADSELNADNFGEETELTEHEKDVIERLRAEQPERMLVINDTDEAGQVTQIPATEYAKTLDDRSVVLDGIDAEADEILKTINRGDVVPSEEDLRAQSRKHALDMYHTMVRAGAPELSDEQFLELDDQVMDALKKFYEGQKLTSNLITTDFRKRRLDDMAKILPRQFMDCFVTENEIKFNNIQARERFINVLSFMVSMGPEMDYLNDYIENENKLLLVSKRLMECQVNFSEMLKDKDKLSSIVARSQKYISDDTSFWSKYIKLPNRVHNEFAQGVVIFEEYEDAYERLLEEYPDTPENAEARKLIQNEIDECEIKQEVYAKISDLELMKKLYAILAERYHSNKKLSLKTLMQDAEDSVERIRRCKQQLPFPGFQDNMRKSSQILSAYLLSYTSMLISHNHTIEDMEAKDDYATASPKFSMLRLPDREEEDVCQVLALLLVILMGRILKNLTKDGNDNKYNAITLDSYFRIFCRLGTDLYLTEDIWSMLRDDVSWVLNEFYLPQKDSYLKAEAKKQANRKK